jgi:lipopolysaccharide export system permease protein
MTLNLSKSRDKAERKPKSMNLQELSAEILKVRHQGIDPIPLVTEYHRKLTWSFAPLIFILLGFPVAVITHRRAKAANLVLAIAFAAPYYLLSVGCQALASQGWADPAFIMWLPNIVGGSIVAWLNYRLCAS